MSAKPSTLIKSDTLASLAEPPVTFRVDSDYAIYALSLPDFFAAYTEHRDHETNRPRMQYLAYAYTLDEAKQKAADKCAAYRQRLDEQGFTHSRISTQIVVLETRTGHIVDVHTLPYSDGKGPR